MKENDIFVEIKDAKYSNIIPTGSIAIDWGLFGLGGLPTGRIIEIYGKEGCGKTTLAMQIAKKTQEIGGYIFLADTERWDISRIKQIGIEIDKKTLIRISGNTLEDIFMNIYAAIEWYKKNKLKKPVLIVFDSIALTPSKKEMEAIIKGNSAPIGVNARALTSILKTLQLMLENTPILVLIINQYRRNLTNINKPSFMSYGAKEFTVTGGEALKFACDAIIELKPKKKIVVDNLVMGHTIQAFTEKNKIAPPNITYEYIQYYNGKIGNWYTVHQVGVESEIIAQKGAWFSFSFEDKTVKYQGQEGILKLKDKEYDYLKQEIIKYMRNKLMKINNLEVK